LGLRRANRRDRVRGSRAPSAGSRPHTALGDQRFQPLEKKAVIGRLPRKAIEFLVQSSELSLHLHEASVNAFESLLVKTEEAIPQARKRVQQDA
jgi:hypothetical protein